MLLPRQHRTHLFSDVIPHRMVTQIRMRYFEFFPVEAADVLAAEFFQAADVVKARLSMRPTS
jgi:hypothetical protein